MSRTRIYSSISVVVLIYGVPLLTALWSGVAVGARLVGVSHATDIGRLAIVTVNFYAAYLLIASLAIWPWEGRHSAY